MLFGSSKLSCTLLWLESKELGISQAYAFLTFGKKGHVPPLLSPLTPAVGIGRDTREAGMCLHSQEEVGNGTLQHEVFPFAQLTLHRLSHIT